MPELADKLEEARAEVARLERMAATATCVEIGHDWRCLGGANCGCHEWACCSVPVHECARCKACDYGEAFTQRTDRAAGIYSSRTSN